MNRLLLLTLLLSPMPSQAQPSPADSPQPVTLATLQDHYRPILIFASTDTPAFRQQMRTLATSISGLRERDVLIVPLIIHPGNLAGCVAFSAASLGRLSAADQTAARTRFHIAPTAFTVLLLGKDGEEKLRSTQPVTPTQLFRLIDAMPMRRQEMQRASSPQP